MYFAKQDLDSALKEARRAIALDPGQPMALRAVATVEMSSGHYAVARDAWEKLTKIRTEDSDAWLGLKQACRFLGDVDGMAAADRHVHEVLNRSEPSEVTAERPLEISATEKTYIIFSLTVGLLFLMVLAARSVWAAVNHLSKKRGK